MRFPSDSSIPGGLANRGQYIEFYHVVSDTTVSFRAFLTAFEDKYTSEWNEEYAFGRMDPISTFKRTGRKISLGWKIVAEDDDSAAANLAKVGGLVRMLYPAYNASEAMGAISTTHLSGPPLMKLKFMNFVRNSIISDENGGSSAKVGGLLGYVQGFNNSPVLDDGFIEGSGDTIYPKTIEMSCEFTVLHTHDMGWVSGQFMGTPSYPYGDPTAQPGLTEALRQVADPLIDAGRSIYDQLLEITNPPDEAQSDAEAEPTEITEAATEEIAVPLRGGVGAGTVLMDD